MNILKMNKKVAEEILKINKNKDLSYSEKIDKMENLAGQIKRTHKNIITGKSYAKRNQYILEALSVLNKYKSTNWISSDKLSEKQYCQGQPVRFDIITVKNKKIEYCLYNEDQLKEKLLLKEINEVSFVFKKNIKKYTANYSYSNSNFVIQNLSEFSKKNKYYQAICILKNLIQRGNPTLMSAFLQEKIGRIQERDDFNKCYPLITKETPDWKWTIKGCEENDFFPAKDFYYNNIPIDMEDCQFIQQLLLPEVKISEIVDEVSAKSEEFVNQCVDFYLPQIRLVIEIDGSQHKEKEQSVLDKKRDEFLLSHKIETIRITTDELTTKNGSYFNKLKLIRKKIVNLYYENKDLDSPSIMKIDAYKKSYIDGVDLNNPNYLVTGVIRFQVLILELLAQEKLKFDQEWNIELLCRDIKDFAEVAIDDLFIWFEQLFLLMNLEFKKPTINISYVNSKKDFSLSNSIKVDFSILKRYTDENELNPNIIFVRTDYFDDKDYFEISVADLVQYSTTVEKAKQPLLFFAWNLFLQCNKHLTLEKLKFREGQLDIIVNALNRHHTIGLLPTGSGKSICYQLACLLQPAISFVVCPIKSLMVDQSQDLHNVYISRVNSVTSDNTTEEKNQVQWEYKRGKYFFIFISPERFQIKKFRRYLEDINKNYNIAYAVIDEAHCMSEWGHDFRTSYLNLVHAIKLYCSNFSFIALSATASSNVLKDLRIELNLKNEDDIKTPKEYCRKELEFYVINDNQNKYETLVELIKQYREDEFYDDKCGLVFTPTVNSNSKKKSIGCYELSCKLSNEIFDEALGKEEVPFFSGSQPKEYSGFGFAGYKKEVQDNFKLDKYKLLVATKAFGMGVNKGNIAYTVHYGLPASMESFYQEAGRAGREKSLFEKTSAKCSVLISPIDIVSIDKKTDPEDITYLTQKTMDKLWDPDSDYELVQKISKNLYGDLNTQMFFFISGEKSIENDTEVIYKLYQYILNEKSKIILIKNAQQFLKDNFDDIEKYIFKLKQLGVVNDWTVDFVSNQYELVIGDVGIDNIKNGIESSIKKYDKEFSFDKLFDVNNKHYKNLKKVYENNEDDEIKKYIKILLQWNYDTFAYSRRKSLSTVYENCMKVANEEMSREDFKSTIENYFRFSNKAHILQYIADNPQDYKKWFEIFYVFQDSILTEQIIDLKEAQNLIGTISRFLESYMHNTGLDFISGFLRLITNEYEHIDGKSRFESSLNEIKNFNQEKQNNIFERLLDVAQQILNNEQKNSLSKSLTDVVSNENEFLCKIYGKLTDENSLLIISQNFLCRINNIKKKIEVKNES